jgi:hypothetical protein
MIEIHGQISSLKALEPKMYLHNKYNKKLYGILHKLILYIPLGLLLLKLVSMLTSIVLYSSRTHSFTSLILQLYPALNNPMSVLLPSLQRPRFDPRALDVKFVAETGHFQSTSVFPTSVVI